MPYEYARLLADAWCAAFVIPKIKVPPMEPRITLTESTFRKLENNPNVVAREVKDEIAKLAKRYRFFHWHLAFMNVFQPKATDDIDADDVLGWDGGFDVVLGNPPWETFELKEKEWFAQRRPDIANAANAAARRSAIKQLMETDPALYNSFLEEHRRSEGESHLTRQTGRFPLTAFGKTNSFALFAELNRQLLAASGRVGCIIPSGIASDDTTKVYFQDLIQSRSLVSLLSFENEEFLFPGVHHSTKFCLLTLSGTERPQSESDFVYFARQTAALARARQALFSYRRRHPIDEPQYRNVSDLSIQARRRNQQIDLPPRAHPHPRRRARPKRVGHFIPPGPFQHGDGLRPVSHARTVGIRRLETGRQRLPPR